VKSLARQQELGFQQRGPVGFNEFQVTVFIGTVDFIADDWIPGVGKMDPDLVGPAGFGFGFDQGEWVAAESETGQDTKSS